MSFFFASRGTKMENPILASIDFFTALTMLCVISVCVLIFEDRVLYEAAVEMFGASMLVIAVLTALTDIRWSLKLYNWRFASNDETDA